MRQHRRRPRRAGRTSATATTPWSGPRRSLDELDLARHGLRYLDVDPAQQSLRVRRRAGVARVPRRRAHARRPAAHLRPDQVDGYRRYVARRAARRRALQELANQPPTAGRRAANGRRPARPGRRHPAAMEPDAASPTSFGSFFTDDAVIAPGIVVGPVVWGLAPSTPGTGLGALTYAMKHVAQVGRPVGGSGALPAAVLGAPSRRPAARCAATARVAAILCEGERRARRRARRRHPHRGADRRVGLRPAADLRRSGCATPRPRPARSCERWRAAPPVTATSRRSTPSSPSRRCTARSTPSSPPSSATTRSCPRRSCRPRWSTSRAEPTS